MSILLSFLFPKKSPEESNNASTALLERELFAALIDDEKNLGHKELMGLLTPEIFFGKIKVENDSN